ncbi:MAG: choice-of-anchor J domain-containing protein [Bacteroidota bacterium]
MKLVFTLSSFIFILSISAQVEILNENFQQGIPSTWTLSNQDLLTPSDEVSEYNQAWISVLNPNDVNDTVASATSYFSPLGKADRWLISPQIMLGDFGNFLTWESKSQDPSYPENFKVLVSTTTNDVSSFTDTLELFVAENSTWTSHEINLSEKLFNTQAVYIAFVLNTYDGFKFYLDDVKVRKEDPVSVNEIQKNNYSFSPNPVENELFISNSETIKTISLVSTTNCEVYKSNSNLSKINLSELKSGIYFLKITTIDGNTISQKIVKI